MREALEGVYKQCRTTKLFYLGPRLFSPLRIKPSNGSTSRGVLEIVAEPGRVFFPALWSTARFHGHYLYDQSHRSLSLTARRYAVVVTRYDIGQPRKHRSIKRRDSFLTSACCFARNSVPIVIDCVKRRLPSSCWQEGIACKSRRESIKVLTHSG